MANPSIYDDMSRAEYKASEFLKQLGLYWRYEQPVYLLDDKDRPGYGRLIFTFLIWVYILKWWAMVRTRNTAGGK